jgi:hypothetical protein
MSLSNVAAAHSHAETQQAMNQSKIIGSWQAASLQDHFSFSKLARLLNIFAFSLYSILDEFTSSFKKIIF